MENEQINFETQITRHFTSLKESDKLVELGLDKDTADMAYIMHATSDNEEWRYDDDDTPPMMLLFPFSSIFAEARPCWSVGGLLNLMPEINGYVPIIRRAYGEKGYVGAYDKEDGNEYLYGTIVQDNPIEAAYGLMKWLLENGHIKKGQQ